uniref:Putative secreted protein n=1 Tax=Ixodes ricinus TaxID=34613 RepID=A0A6B0UIN9_IXORI
MTMMLLWLGLLRTVMSLALLRNPGLNKPPCCSGITVSMLSSETLSWQTASTMPSLVADSYADSSKQLCALSRSVFVLTELDIRLLSSGPSTASRMSPPQHGHLSDS